MRSLLMLALALFLAAPASAFASAAEPSTSDSETRETLLRGSAASMPTISSVLLLAAVAGAPRDALKSIEKDLSARIPGGKLAPARIEKDEYFVDGKPTGVRVVSFSPLRLKYHGHIWSAAPGASLDKSYASLTKFLATTKVTTHSLLFPEAHAAEPAPETPPAADQLSTPFEKGAIVGTLLGVLVGGAAIAGAPITVAAAATYGAVIGASALAGGMINERRDQLRIQAKANLVADLMNAQFQVKCDGNETRVTSTKSLQDQTQIIVRRFPNKGEARLQLINERGREESVTMLSDDRQKLITDSLLRCNSQADADEIMKRSKDAKQLVATVTAPPAPAASTAPSSDAPAVK